MRWGTFWAHKNTQLHQLFWSHRPWKLCWRPQNTPKWTKIKKKHCITGYSQGKVLFESQTRMVFNEVPEKYLRIPIFPGKRTKNGWLQVLDWKWCLEGLFLFRFTVHCIYIPFINTLDKLAEIIEGWHYLECHSHHTRT